MSQAANVAAPKASLNYLKAAVISTVAVLGICFIARRAPIVGPYADAAIKKALVA